MKLNKFDSPWIGSESFGTCFLLFLGFINLIGFQIAQGANSPTRPLVIEDPAWETPPVRITGNEITDSIWLEKYPQIIPPDTGFTLAMPLRDDSESAIGGILLWNGTEIARLPPTHTAYLLENADFNPDRKFDPSMVQSRERIPFWKPMEKPSYLDSLLDWSTPDGGLKWHYGWNLYTLKTEAVLKNWTEISYLRSEKGFSLGFSFFLQDFDGQTIRRFSQSHQFEENYVGFSIRAGVPFLAYRLSIQPYAIPKYAWLEENLPELVDGEEGEVIRLWATGPNSIYEGSHDTHEFLFTLGKFHYNLILNPDLYQGPVHEFFFKDLSAGWIHWGIGLVTSSGVAVPGFQIKTLPWDLGETSQSLSGFILGAMQMEIFFRKNSVMELGLSTYLEFPDPLNLILGGK